MTFSGLIQCAAQDQPDYGWYTEGDDNIPGERIRITVTNPLDIPLENQPVVIKHSDLPAQGIPERWINIVDPNLPPREDPTLDELKEYGGYLYREETHGRTITQQVDDITKDGIWDEIFFVTDLEPRESRDFFIYIGFYERGIHAHRTHGAIGNYGRMTVPFWESENMGWKLWYPHDVDLHGKVEPLLTAYPEYQTNRSGYYMAWELGTDIMQVRDTFGAGGMCIFEDPEDTENPARAYHSPQRDMGPYKDTRYTYDVEFNGPLRSRIKVTTRNWNSERGGFYELEQFYTAVVDKDWSTVGVKFSQFRAPRGDAMFGAGIREVGITESEEYKSVVGDGYVISMGQNIEARIPDEDIGDEALEVPWQATALIVKEEYQPEYVSIDNWRGNHLFKIPVTEDLSYEYMISGAWSHGVKRTNEEQFVEYIENEALKYNNPPEIEIHEHETRD
ncbi:MAG: DUF4861 family protein [Balneolaceae bacterium]